VLARPLESYDASRPLPLRAPGKWGGTISQQEAHLWRELYRVLFDRNVAGIVLTNVDGCIVDCNETCARIFGFESRDDMLEHSAWDLYFDRADREQLLERFRKQRDCPSEEVCLRHSNGMPVWVLATRSVVSLAYGHPELLQGTVIDITAQKKAQASLGRIKEVTSPASRPERANSETADLSQRLSTLLQRASQALQPDNLLRLNRPEIQEFVLVLEEMKMLMSELEVLRLFRK
jgi:PAS domain S-box-containing protein